jgi:hypothetical protein
MRKNTENANPGLRLTRRAVLTAAAGAAGALIAAKASPPKANAHEHHPKPPFDIRRQVGNTESDDECIQCVYDDAINRMVILIGDIPFAQLFTLQMIKLVPLVQPQIRVAATFDLIEDPDEVAELADELSEEASRSTISEFFVLSRDQVPSRTRNLLIALRRQGIKIPLPLSDGSLTNARSDALQQLISVAPDLTFKRLFTDAQVNTPEPVVAALSAVQALGLLGWFKNDRCCKGMIAAAATMEFFEGGICTLDSEMLNCSLISTLCAPFGTSS